MDAHDYARLASLVSAERSVVNAALARFRGFDIGTDWRGRSRAVAEAAKDDAIAAATHSLRELDNAEAEALRLWRAALAATHPLGV